MQVQDTHIDIGNGEVPFQVAALFQFLVGNDNLFPDFGVGFGINVPEKAPIKLS